VEEVADGGGRVGGGHRRRHGWRRRGHQRLLLHFHRHSNWRPLPCLHCDDQRPLLGFFTVHGGVAPSHLQPHRPRPTARCCVSKAGDAACPSGRALPPPAGGLPLRAALTPPAVACPGGRCWLPLAVGQRRPGGAAARQRRGDSGTKEGRQLGFGRSHRFIYRRAKWASWAVVLVHGPRHVG
jgi:hypothetical protein